MIAETNGYVSTYDISGKLLSTVKADTHNNSLLVDTSKSAIVSIGGTNEGEGTKHRTIGLNLDTYALSAQKIIENRSKGNAIGFDSYGSKDYIITVGRKQRSYLFKRSILWNRK